MSVMVELFLVLLANAIVHKDYLINANIKVEFWDDYVRIVSPGSLPTNITEKEFQNGNVSVLRNEIIASVFQRLDIIESFATGIQRIRKLYLEFPEQPKFEVFANSISVTLPRINYRKHAVEFQTDAVISYLKDEPRARAEI